MSIALRFALLAAAVGTLAATAFAADPPACDVKSLNGAFGYKLSGFVYDTRGSMYILGAAGRVVSDGAGNLTGSETYSFDGSIVKRDYAGTYSVNADCTGSLTLTTSTNDVTHAYLVIVNNGIEADLVQTDLGFIVTGAMKQQNPPIATPTQVTPSTPTEPPATSSLQRR